MQIGDLIRLNAPFTPTPNSSASYQYAVIVEIMPKDDLSLFSQDSPELLVYLCEGDPAQPYIDELGDRPLYSFSSDEVELVQ